ncbi:hypothetical protein NEF87_004914 [Candidatus Lokiarchaeum ossiferum]|uniref:NACHT domain-containing protein n=1 Tax=Candidatus Lokiarchaeum ossiferum TaxID=2951803 RepID=A0ABY6I1R2_9ARCH|nr:hypothetical protein NEF87_004914 [Candidatus Lokiarchaeum sp. B-35]
MTEFLAGLPLLTPPLKDILLNLVSDGIYDALSKHYPQCEPKDHNFNDQLNRIIKLCFEKAEEEYMPEFKKFDKTTQALIKSFFHNTNVITSLINRLYFFRYNQQGQVEIPSDVKTIFVLHFQKVTLLEDKKGEEIGLSIYASLINLIQKVLDEIYQSRFLGDAGTMTDHRTLLLIEEMRTQSHIIQSNFQKILTDRKTNIEAILKFEIELRDTMANAMNDICIHDIDEKKRCEIKDIFVSPKFKSFNPEKELEREEIFKESFTNNNLKSSILKMSVNMSNRFRSLDLDINGLLKDSYYSVILGDPGSGKSTLTKVITYKVNKNYESKLIFNRHLTVLPIILRDYSPKMDELSILNYIENKAQVDYSLTIPENALNYLAQQGRIAIILDGLDELDYSKHRNIIITRIEAFIQKYPYVPVIGTSRIIGYQNAPLKKSKFAHYTIEPFDNNQIKEYITKSFALLTNSSNWKQNTPIDEIIEDFMIQSQTVSDIRSNPLLLALMSKLFLNSRSIPQSRPEIYESCTKMLLKQWYVIRNIETEYTLDEINDLLSLIAYNIYQHDDYKQGIKKTDIINILQEYLLEIKFKYPPTARNYANNFIESCTGRLWVLTDVGLSESNEKIYNFTHKTFMEYFVSVYINATKEGGREIYKFLKPNILNIVENEISQLTIQILGRNSPTGFNSFFDSLVSSVERTKDNKKKITMLDFILTFLPIKFPKLTILSKIFKATFKLVGLGSVNSDILTNALHYRQNKSLHLIFLQNLFEELGPSGLLSINSFRIYNIIDRLVSYRFKEHENDEIYQINCKIFRKIQLEILKLDCDVVENRLEIITSLLDNSYILFREEKKFDDYLDYLRIPSFEYYYVQKEKISFALFLNIHHKAQNFIYRGVKFPSYIEEFISLLTKYPKIFSSELYSLGTVDLFLREKITIYLSKLPSVSFGLFLLLFFIYFDPLNKTHKETFIRFDRIQYKKSEIFNTFDRTIEIYKMKISTTNLQVPKSSNLSNDQKDMILSLFSVEKKTESARYL